MTRKDALANAKKAKNDEFYTLYEDIEKELSHYKAFFCGKRVYCPCDDPSFSNFYRFFVDHFFDYGLKEVVFTWLGGSEFYKLIRRGDTLYNEYGLTFNSGDFAENGHFFRACDIVVTNPPFSLWRKFFKCVIDAKKKFLILGNQNAIIYKEVFSLIKNNKVWFGESIHGGDREFRVPASYPLNANGVRVDENGNRYVRVTGIRWFTNLGVVKRHKTLCLYKKYVPDEYPKYDNYDAINVDKTKNIPCDYDGIMGVPVTFLDKYNPKQFEILGLWNTGVAGDIVGAETCSALSAGKIIFWNGPTVSGKTKYARILVRKRKTAVQ